MSKENQNDQLRKIVSALTDETRKISKEQTAYFNELPKGSDISFGVEVKDQKKLATAYYKHITFLAESLSRMENALAPLPSVMIEADRNFCYDIIMECDELLKRYGEFKSGISLFAKRNEKLITENNVSASKMFRYLSELGYKLNYFDEYLKELSL